MMIISELLELILGAETEIKSVWWENLGTLVPQEVIKPPQTPEAKRTAIAKAEAKRRRKGQKRYHDYVNCLFNSAIVKHSCRLHHWQVSVVTASPA